MSISPTATSPPGRVALLLLALLAGCATQAPQAPDTGWDAHRLSVSNLESWSFSGRVAIRTADGADSARLRWRQDAENLEMTVSGPAGFKQATLTRKQDKLTLLRDGRQQVLDPANNPLASQFGWDLPLDYLPWWLRGLPAPQLAAERSEVGTGRLSLLEQGGWTVEYPEYQWVDGRQLPRTIRFRRDEVEGKILLKDWVLEL